MGCYFFLSWLLWARLPFQGLCIHCWASDPLFLPLGPNGPFLFFKLFIQSISCGPYYWAFLFTGLSTNGPQHLAPWTYESFLRFICEWKDASAPFSSSFFFSFFAVFFFKLWTPFFIHTYILLPAANKVVSSNFPVWQLFSKQSRRFINSIPFWWLTLHLFSCWH